MRRVYILIFTASWVFFLGKAAAQTDKEFWFAAPDLSSGHCDSLIMLRFTTLNQASVVTLSQPANPSFIPIQLSVAANQTGTIDLKPYKNQIECAPANTVVNHGLRITATHWVQANYELSCNNLEVFPLKGRNALGDHFVVPFQQVWNNPVLTPAAACSFTIVAVEDNTSVTIIPSHDIIGHPAATPFTVTLQRGQAYSAVATTTAAASHLGGSIVYSDKPVAVTTADDSVLTNLGLCLDLLGDQLVPESRTGTDYIVIKGFLPSINDRFYVYATADNTSVFLNGNTSPVTTIDRGEYYVSTILNPSIYIHADKDVYVTHITGFGCEVADAVVPPLACTGNTTVAFYHPTLSNYYGLIIVASGGEGNFTVDGNTSVITASAFTAVPGTAGQWMAARINFTNITGNSVKVTNSSHKFIMGLLGGYSSGSSYGYPTDYGPMRLDLGNDTTLCPSNALLLDAGNSGSSYLWQDGSSTQYFNVVSPGSYHVTVTDPQGCTDTTSININYYEAGLVTWTEALSSRCVTDMPFALTGGSPPGGTYSGIGVMGNNFSPATGAGNYTLMYTAIDENGCEQSAYNTLTVNFLPGVFFNTFMPDQCVDETEYYLSGAIPPGGTYTGDGVSNGIFNPSLAGPGTHWITYSYTDDNGCTNFAMNYITVRELPEVSFSGALDDQCVSYEMYLLTGGTPLGGTYSGPGVSGFIFNASQAGAGTHTIYYSFSDMFGCTATDSSTIVVHPLPAVSWNTVYPPMCESAPPFLLTGGTPPGGIYSGPGTLGGGFSPAIAGPGVHIIKYSFLDNHNCSNSASIEITVNPLPQVSFSGLFPEMCLNDNPLLLITGIPAGGTYMGQGVAGGIFDPSLAGQGTHTITYTYTDVNNCTAITTSTLSVFPVPAADAGAELSVLCEGEDLHLTGLATGGSGTDYTYSWTGPSFASSLENPVINSVTTVNTGKYVLLVSDEHGCHSKDSVFVTVNPVPHPLVSSNSPVCEGAALNLSCNLNNMASYQWNGPGAYISGLQNPVRNNVLPPHSGTYTVTVTNSFTCQGTASTEVTIHPLPVALAGPDQNINYGVYTYLNGSSSGCGGFCDYLWSPAVMLNGPNTVAGPMTVNLIADQNYILVLTDTATGCQSIRDTVTIHVSGSPISLNPVAIPSVICEGSSSNLMAQAGGGNLSYTYAWSPAAGLSGTTIANPVATPAVSTTYTVTVSDGYNQVSGVVGVSVSPNPYVYAGPDTTVCGCSAFTLSQAIDSSVAGISWVTYFDGVFSDPNSLQPVYTPGPTECLNGYCTLYLTGLGMTPCNEDRDTIVVTLAPIAVAFAGEDDTICAGTTYTLYNAEAVNAGELLWSTSGDGHFNDSSLLHPIYIPGPGDIATGNVSLTLLVMNASSFCGDSSSTLVLIIKLLPNAYAGQDVTICSGDSVQLEASGGDSYIWIPGNSLSDDSIANPVAFPTSTTIYMVNVTHDGCSKTDEVMVTVRWNPVLNLSPEAHICPGDSALLWAEGATNWLWTTGATTTAIWVSPDLTTYYYVTGTDDFGCSSIGQLVVTVDPAPVLTVDPAESDICRGDYVMISVNGAQYYSWKPKTGLSNSYSSLVKAAPSHTTDYVVTGTNTQGCKSSIHSLVRVVDKPVLSLPDSTFLCEGDKITLNAGWNDDVIYTWQDGQEGQFYPVTEPGIYSVIASNAGCDVSDTVSVYTCALIWVPNAFTPDGNNLNEKFLVKTTTELLEYHIYIFSRKGELVYQSMDIYDGWDGRFKGSICEPGVFTWVIYYRSRDAGRQLIKGTLTLFQ